MLHTLSGTPIRARRRWSGLGWWSIRGTCGNTGTCMPKLNTRRWKLSQMIVAPVLCRIDGVQERDSGTCYLLWLPVEPLEI